MVGKHIYDLVYVAGLITSWLFTPTKGLQVITLAKHLEKGNLQFGHVHGFVLLFISTQNGVMAVIPKWLVPHFFRKWSELKLNVLT